MWKTTLINTDKECLNIWLLVYIKVGQRETKEKKKSSGALLLISTSPSLCGPGMASACRYWHYYYYYHRHQPHSSGPRPHHWPRLTDATESWMLSTPGYSPVISTHVLQDQCTPPFVHRTEIYKHTWRFTNWAPKQWRPRSKFAEWLPLLSWHKWCVLCNYSHGNCCYILILQLAPTDSVKLISKSDSKVPWRGRMEWFPNPLVVMDLHQSSLDLTQSPITWCNFDTKQTAFDKRSQLCSGKVGWT